MPENVAVKVLNRAHSLTADVEIPEGGAEGVLVCHGSNAGGYTLFVKDSKLHYVHNYVGAQEFHVESSEPVPEGKSKLRYEFEPTGKPDIAKGKGTPGRAQLYIDDKLVGQADLPVHRPAAHRARRRPDASAAIPARRCRSSTSRRSRSPARSSR